MNFFSLQLLLRMYADVQALKNDRESSRNEDDGDDNPYQVLQDFGFKAKSVEKVSVLYIVNVN